MRRLAIVNSQPRTSSALSMRTRGQPRHACANVSAVSSSETSTSKVRRVRNTRTGSASRSYNAMNASGEAMAHVDCRERASCDSAWDRRSHCRLSHENAHKRDHIGPASDGRH